MSLPPDGQPRRDQKGFALDEATHILESVTDAFYALDREWRFTYLNPQAERLLARSQEELLGRSVWDEFPEAVGSGFDRQYHRAMAEQTPVFIEEFYAPLDIWFEVRAYPSEGGLSVFLQNVNDRKQTERRLQRLFDSQVVGVIFWNLDTGLITDANDTFLSMVGYTREDLAAGLLDFRRMTPPEWEQRNEQGVATIRAEGSAPTYEKEYFRKDGSRVPILIGGTRFEESGAEGFSYILDITERKRHEERERARLEDIFMRAPAFMATLRGPQHVFEMVNPPYYQVVGHRDILGKPVAMAIPEVVEQGFIGILDRVYQTGEPFIGKDVRLLLQVTLYGPLEERFVDFVYQPLYGEDKEVWGILAHGIDLTERKHLEFEQERLLGEARARAEREALLNRINDVIRTAKEPERIREAATALVGEALAADRCFYVTYNPTRGDAQVSQDWHRSDLPSIAGGYRATDFGTLLEELFPEPRTAVVEDVGQAFSAAVASVFEAFRHRAVLVVPFFDGGDLAAALYVSMADAPRTWSGEEVALVEQVATLTRASLETALVAQREHRIAEQLAQALQPPIPTHVPGLKLAEFYRPAWEDQGVGGDFSDVFSDDKGITFLVVGDLSGKGLAAASQVATVRHMLRFALLNGGSVAGPVTALNRTLADHEMLTGFATLFVGRFDAGTRALTWVNAGQDAGLILRAATGQVETLPPTGPVLGAISGAVYLEETVALEAGDVLALYTDGLTEAGPSRIALLTGDGVADLLQGLVGVTNPRVIAEHLMAGVDAFSQGGVRDDQCLLVGVVFD